jgi:hypothetical protein
MEMVPVSECGRGPGAKRRIGRIEIAHVLLVAAILIMSAVSVVLYRQSKDYHDAKYRAQYLVVDDLLRHLTIASNNLPRFLDESLPIESRYDDGQSGLSGIFNAQHMIRILEMMYLDDYETNLTFGTMEQALGQFHDEVYMLLSSMYNNMTWDVPYSDNSTLNGKLDTALVLMQGLTPYIEAGKRSGQFKENPYSLVDGMSMDGILENSNAMLELGFRSLL